VGKRGGEKGGKGGERKGARRLFPFVLIHFMPPTGGNSPADAM